MFPAFQHVTSLSLTPRVALDYRSRHVFTSQVICKNKREGKQLAAQSILQKLHPYVTCWGSLLRLYGTNWKAIKEKVSDNTEHER